MVPGTTDEGVTVNDDERLALAQAVLDQHFGLRAETLSGSVCATCRGVSWPCPPSRLAAQVKEEVLAR